MSKIEEITKNLKDYAYSLSGVDLVGIADVKNIPEYYPPRSPEDVLEGARYVVIYAQKMLWGSIENKNLRIATLHTSAMYDSFFILSEQIGSWLESRGYRAATFNHYLPLEMSKETRGMSGDLSLKHIAIAAGLGRMGKSRLILTEKYGPRVRFGAVLTDGELISDEPKYGQPEICNHCNACITHCPVNAIKEDGIVDTWSCLPKSRLYGLLHFNRYIKKIINEGFLEMSNEDKKETIIKILKDPFWWNCYQELESGIFYGCFECLTNCPAGEDFKKFKRHKE